MTRGGARGVLLIEDNPDDRELAIRALQTYDPGVAIHHVRDGPEALDFLLGTGATAEAWARGAVGVVLLDLTLPKVDGLEVLRRVKGDARTRAIPVVVMSSSREARDVTQCYEAGANSYVVKPLDCEEFNDALRQIGHYWLALNQLPSG